MLRSLAFRGIPCGEGDGPVNIKILRIIVWKVIIGYLPTETHKWEQHMKNQQKTYNEWVEMLIVKPELRPT